MSDVNRTIVVITGLGMVTAAGIGRAANLAALAAPPPRARLADYWLPHFDPVALVPDRKLRRTVANRDVIGLAALFDCARDSGWRPEGGDPSRAGLFVGSPSPTFVDNDAYGDAVRATRSFDEAAFGVTVRRTNPTALLMALPNNVLAHGARLLEARGPNANYTAFETSGHIAVLGAARAVRLGRADRALAGGYHDHTDPEFIGSLHGQSQLRPEPDQGRYEIDADAASGTIIAPGGAFVALERADIAAQQGHRILGELAGGALGADATPPYTVDREGAALATAIGNALARAGLSANEVGLVCVSACGIAAVDEAEWNAVASVFHSVPCKPAVATAARSWGNLMEAGGLGELALACAAQPGAPVPAAVRYAPAVRAGFASRFDLDRPVALVTRVSSWGDCSCILMRQHRAG